jgi:hypothetical protein
MSLLLSFYFINFILILLESFFFFFTKILLELYIHIFVFSLYKKHMYKYCQFQGILCLCVHSHENQFTCNYENFKNYKLSTFPKTICLPHILVCSSLSKLNSSTSSTYIYIYIYIWSWKNLHKIINTIN